MIPACAPALGGLPLPGPVLRADRPGDGRADRRPARCRAAVLGRTSGQRGSAPGSIGPSSPDGPLEGLALVAAIRRAPEPHAGIMEALVAS